MRLAEYMDLHRLRDETVAAAIGRSRVSVNRYRRGLFRPDWDTVEAIHTYTAGAVSANDWMKETAAPVTEAAE